MNATLAPGLARDGEWQYGAVIDTPWADVRLGLVIRDGALFAIDFLDQTIATLGARDAAAREIVIQLQRYFTDPQAPLRIPVAASGTDFQHRVWAALRRIPAGGTRHYGDLAQELGSGARAVGAACRANPVPLVVPCHRVVARSGPGGFMGRTNGRAAWIKATLLAHERDHR